MAKGDENKQNIIAEADVEVEAMPTEFYGGANPVIKFKEAPKEVILNKTEPVPKPAEKKAFEQKTAVGGVLKLHPANLLTSPKFLLAASGAVLLLFLIGGGIYYFLLTNKDKNSALTLPPPAITPETVAEEAATTTEEIAGAEEFAAPTVPSLQDTPVKYPSVLLTDTADTDKDTITDIAEEVFNTNANSTDTDGDKYTDDTEIYNLYNPAGIAPMRLIDSNLVKEYTNPVFGYKIYYPVNWVVGNVDPEYRDVLFSTLNGENVEVRVFSRNNSTFEDWFTQWAPDQKLQDIKPFETYFKDPGNKRFDDLVYYFMDSANIYVVVLHPFDSTPGSLAYRFALTMMARSFRLNGTPELFIPRMVEENPFSAPSSVAPSGTNATSSGL